MAEKAIVKDPILWETFGWTEDTIASGTIYYHNTKTNEKSLEKPQDWQDEETEKAGDWIQQIAVADMVYYYNTNTKESTWETPEMLRQQRLKQTKQFHRKLKMFKQSGPQDVPLPVPKEKKQIDLQNIKSLEGLPLSVTKEEKDIDSQNVKGLQGLPLSVTKEEKDIDSQNVKEKLIQKLKNGYKQLFDAILPIPFIQDRVYCVNNIFIESAVELKTVNWSPLSSHQDVLSDARVTGRERILTGEPGFGKSTLTMQYAFEWYTEAEGSFMRDVEILIFLRLRKLHGVHSIFEAIRRFLLPQNCSLTKSKVELAIRNSPSVVVILDGLDEFDGEETSSAAVVTALMADMLEKVKVLVTSRNYPSNCSPETIRFRLTGFDERAQEAYIRKAVAGDDEVAAGRIMQLLNKSPILVDLCKIPLFFAMFAHMTHEDENLKPFRTVTRFFKCLIKCLYSHMRNKLDDTNIKISSTFQADHKELDKVAFECLSGKKIIWKKEELRERLGESLYNEYSALGILIEEEVPFIATEGKPPYIENETEVRFYHQHFCDWYGAHFIQSCADTFDDKHLKETLGYLTPLRHQYCYRFACGLNPQCAKRVITYLKDNEQSDMFAEVCTIEQLDEVDYNFLKNLEDLCSRGVAFYQDDNKLKIQSTIQLLEIASSHQIPIKMVSLINCHWRVDMSSNFLQLSHNFRLPVLTTLRYLIIQWGGRKIEEADWETFLLYLSKCLTLKSVKIYNGKMPQLLRPDFVSSHTLRTCEVSWYPYGYTHVWYNLCLRSGLWKRASKDVVTVMTHKDDKRDGGHIPGDGGQ